MTTLLFALWALDEAPGSIPVRTNMGYELLYIGSGLSDPESAKELIHCTGNSLVVDQVIMVVWHIMMVMMNLRP